MPAMMGVDVQYRVCPDTHQAADEIEGELLRCRRRERGLHDSVQLHSIEQLVNRQPGRIAVKVIPA
jgi:hypothetical protein